MKTIVCCGKKQTGKSSAAKFITGLVLYNKGIISEFSQNSDGDLLVKTDQGWGILDLYRRDYEFIEWASQVIWPHVRIYSFAEELKTACFRIFGISLDLLLVNKEQKTNIQFKQVKKFIPEEFQKEYSKLKPNSYLTGRQFLVIFGTYICREIDPDCWVRRTYQDIDEYKSQISIIDDCRFENEFIYSTEKEAELLLFKDENIGDNNPSESFSFPEEKFSLVIYKNKQELHEKNELIKQHLLSKGILEVSI